MKYCADEHQGAGKAHDYDRVFYIIWLTGLTVLALRPSGDFDTFWQLQSAKQIWQTKAFLYTDTFSLAKDMPRFEHPWLSDLIFLAFYSLGGFVLLGLLKTAIVTVCGLLTYRRARQMDVPALLTIPLLTICFVASSSGWVERPQLWTFLLSIVYLKLLFDGRENGLKSWGWLPLLMILWANLHAGAVFGLVLTGLFGCAEIVRAIVKQVAWPQVGRLFIVGCLTAGASFCNPNITRIPNELLAHANLTRLTVGQQYISEWLPPTAGQAPLFYALFAVWALLILVRIRRVDPAELIFFIAFLYMGWNQSRHASFVPLLLAFFLPLAVSQAIGPRVRDQFFRYGRIQVACWGVVLLFGVLISYSAVKGKLGVGLIPDRFPERAVDFILKNRLPANLYNFYDWGGYLMWRLYPDYLVFVDGRNTSIDMLHASNRIDDSTPGWREDLDQFGVNTVITKTCYYNTGGPIQLVETLAFDPGWALVYADDVAVVFIRRQESFRQIWQPLALPAWTVYRTMYAEASRLYHQDQRRSRALLALARSALVLGKPDEATRYFEEFRARGGLE